MRLQSFSAVTLDQPAFFSVGVLDAPTQTPIDPATNIIKGMKIFRTGRFTDTFGRTNDWTQEHLQAMVNHFTLLRGNPIVVDGETIFDGPLPLIPQRLDHTISIKDVIGYFANMYLDPMRPGFLFADVAITEPDHLAKYRRGTYRNRSIEIGSYQDNNGNKYEPVVLGLAFVDLPSVEGLFGRHGGQSGQPGNDQSFSVGALNQGESMSKTPEHIKAEEDLAAAQTALIAAQAAVTAAETARTAADQLNATLTTSLAEKESLLVAARSGQLTPQTFSISGAATQDFAAVQAHIVMLETFRNETITTHRTSFVDQLATTGRIANPQKENFTKLALGMSSEQFDIFKAGFDASPALQLFGSIPTTVGTPPAGGGAVDFRAARISALQETVASHRRGGMSEDDIKTKPSYIELQQLLVQS